ncbi:BsuBI/PstI restriction endonuclease C-terminus [Mycobacteroides abscessus subsp. abscessus]|uniref:BsuBI/PstI family type II restriction endonuclease n=1 Tax=Mycobacteroides abscessus TaxID=36809 RepID=UPI000927E22C|nr:BsuBI/PstI family type II restriction endonuclease [Mycobacteroides abscessus]SIE78918.1 BsuBI/PstI restriction endonuclease C-terminus [Mycobacteroides abscessus subsp. abscessus]SLF18366.1 BsuBI/PstI restriction endonuclease C-terminus [Mycobacteroides abscessus subsp. abscessus]SLF30790.1 BsuBI/PstI restriction endonuclease C-terminus [Mycobacteroides abscessus subsp. abscessus]SLF35121.1 BsuBI/PstI restriction endonuclease C-terminus [Mycobacteroides abscessus subsp. abscessus]SLF96022.
MTNPVPSLPALLSDRAAYKKRLEMILPQSITGTTHSANDAAATVAFVMIYVGAVDGTNPVRPSTVYWMRDSIAQHRTDAERASYYQASLKSERAVDKVQASWGTPPTDLWYKTNTRESIRDDTIKTWISNGVAADSGTVITTSSQARYTFLSSFAALLDPALTGTALDTAVKKWQQTNLSPTGKLRAARARTSAQNSKAVSVHLPDGTVRKLNVGRSSEIIKGVIEEFAPAYLSDPAVIFISQSGDKVNIVDAAMLKQLGLPINQQSLLPDLVLADLDPQRDEVWMVEAVATDGPITDPRRQALLDWATAHGVLPEKCRFLTAFTSRTASPFKKSVPVIARGSFAWFLDEPDALLSWDDLNP